MARFELETDQLELTKNMAAKRWIIRFELPA
jgi:hypothetical protein